MSDSGGEGQKMLQYNVTYKRLLKYFPISWTFYVVIDVNINTAGKP